MLSYLILTTRAMLMAAVIMGVVAGYTRIVGDNWQRWVIWTFTCLGTVASIIIAILRNATNLIDSAILNGILYTISLIAFVLYLVFSTRVFTRSDKKPLQALSWVTLGLIVFTVIAYAMPEVWGYPYHVLLSEKTVISTDFLLAMIGMVFGMILSVVSFLAAEHCTMRISGRMAYFLLVFELLLNAALRLAGWFSVLFQKKIVKQNHTMFAYTVFIKNHSDWFIFLSLAAVAIVAVGLWIGSFRQNEPYRNPAEHRKIRAKWRSIRRWATAFLVTLIFGVCNLTVVEAMNETDTSLSPIEDATSVDDENVYVAFDLVNDGHLHRFAYETDDGIVIRFIVIQKPNSSAYGIGLDACDVCGETGYYEKDGQVVCNLCDVVMNISTIGFKGGCNPIVIPYEIKDGQIIVPISGLVEYESEFK